MTHPTRITVKLGTLAEPLAAHLAETGQAAAEYVRDLIATDLGVRPPEMRPGPPAGDEAAREHGRRGGRIGGRGRVG